MSIRLEADANAHPSSRGYAMAALLVGLAVASVLLSMAMPVWRTLATREREQELVFRGQQYARAVGLFQRKYANAYPPSLDVLLTQRFLRKKFRDPMTKDGEFQLLYQSSVQQSPGAPGGAGAAGQIGSPGRPGGGGRQGGLSSGAGGEPAGPRGGIVGVASKSKDKSLRIYNGRTVYNEWQFVWIPSALGPGGPQGGSQARPGPAGGVGAPRRPGGGPPGGRSSRPPG